MIRLGEERDKPALKELWKLCFPHDTDVFVDFYFDRVYHNDETLVLTTDERPVASLQMIPYSIKNGDSITLAGYISGAMTHPGFRQKGYMGQLLTAAFGVMRNKGYDYSFLIPQEEWLFLFYEKYGFKSTRRTVHDERQTVNQPSSVCRLPFTVCLAPFTLFPNYIRLLEGKSPVVLKTEQQFANILRDFFDEQGVLFANEAGMAFTLQEKDTIVIKEFFYPDKAGKELFLNAIRKHYRLDQVILPDEYKGMIKKLNPAAEEIRNVYLGMMLD
jgi:ribosomal protein S18 acetylase RimI-like enzyme